MANFIRRDIEENDELDSELYSELKQLGKTSKPDKKKKGGCGMFIAVIIILLLAGGSLLYYLYSQGQLKPLLVSLKIIKQPKVILSFEPSDAVVIVDGHQVSLEKLGDAQLALILTEGSHKLTVEKDGFRSVSQDIEVPKSTDLMLNKIVLEKKTPGIVKFKVSEQEAKIYFDSEILDKVSYENGMVVLNDIAAGKHSLLIKKSGYESFLKDFNMPVDDGIDFGIITLKATNWRPLEIEVHPRTVDVWVDGEKVESSIVDNLIVTEPIEPGTHKIEVKSEGYLSWINETVEVYSDIANSIGPLELQKNPEKKSIKIEEKKLKDEKLNDDSSKKKVEKEVVKDDKTPE